MSYTPIKMNAAYNAFRAALVTELQDALLNKFLPNFRAEMEDISREHQEIVASNEALANNKRHARELDLKMRRDQFIKQLQLELRSKCLCRVEEYQGEIEEIETNGKKQTRVTFPDKSQANVPNGLWIDYKLFDRAAA